MGHIRSDLRDVPLEAWEGGAAEFVKQEIFQGSDCKVRDHRLGDSQMLNLACILPRIPQKQCCAACKAINPQTMSCFLE